MKDYATVKQTWFSGLKHRIGHQGKILEVIPSQLGHNHDSLILEFCDGEQELFTRDELEPQDSE